MEEQMQKVKVVNIDGIEYEVSYELINNDVNRILEIKLNSIDKDIYDHLSSEVLDEIDEQIYAYDKSEGKNYDADDEKEMQGDA
jgi:hypothetical protein